MSLLQQPDLLKLDVSGKRCWRESQEGHWLLIDDQQEWPILNLDNIIYFDGKQTNNK